MRMVGRLLLGGVVVTAVYLAVTGVQVWWAAQQDEATAADAIVVLGAAQYDGQPSPALENRLDHAVALYEDGFAPVIWVTGGKRPGDRVSEASASASYLIRRGVPNAAIKLEVQGSNTYESLAAAGRFLRQRGERDVLLVSDPWHAYRVKATAGKLGLRAHVSPTDAGGTSEVTMARLARETVAVAVGRVVGYRRLTVLDDRLSASGR